MIGAHGPSGMKVDTTIYERDHIVHKVIGNTACQRTAFGSWKRTVNIFAIGHIAGIIQKTINIDDRHAHHRSPFYLVETPVENSAHDLHSIDLITVHTG